MKYLRETKSKQAKSWHMNGQIDVKMDTRTNRHTYGHKYRRTERKTSGSKQSTVQRKKCSNSHLPLIILDRLRLTWQWRFSSLLDFILKRIFFRDLQRGQTCVLIKLGLILSLCLTMMNFSMSWPLRVKLLWILEHSPSLVNEQHWSLISQLLEYYQLHPLLFQQWQII